MNKRNIDPPICEYLNKRPYNLVHKIKESWAEEDIDSEGNTIRAFYYSKSYCGLRLSHDKWDNRKVGIDSYNCTRCKNKENK